MSTDLNFYVCLDNNPNFSPVVVGLLQAYLDDGFLERLEPALKKARDLGRKVLVCPPGDVEELEFTEDAYGEPLTYLKPEDLDGITDTHPANQALLDYITKNTFRYALIVVLYWN